MSGVFYRACTPGFQSAHISVYIYLLLNRTQGTSKKNTNTDTQKKQKYRHKKESEINPNDKTNSLLLQYTLSNCPSVDVRGN